MCVWRTRFAGTSYAAAAAAAPVSMLRLRRPHCAVYWVGFGCRRRQSIGMSVAVGTGVGLGLTSVDIRRHSLIRLYIDRQAVYVNWFLLAYCIPTTGGEMHCEMD